MSAMALVSPQMQGRHGMEMIPRWCTKEVPISPAVWRCLCDGGFHAHGEMRASSGQARSMSFSWRTTPSLVPSSPPTDSFAATSVLIVPFFVLFAVMECYANGVLMNFLGSPPALSLCGCSLAPQFPSCPGPAENNENKQEQHMHPLSSARLQRLCMCVCKSWLAGKCCPSPDPHPNPSPPHFLPGSAHVLCAALLLFLSLLCCWRQTYPVMSGF